MKTSDFYYDLPEELIAQDPLADRSSSRLMHLDPVTGKVTHDTFKNVINYLEPGDTLVIKSIDRLGRNYDEILEQWHILTKEKGAAIVVLDMPLLDTRQGRDLTGQLIADIVLQLLSYVAQTEREFIRQRQAEGIAAARARGVNLGRRPLPRPDNYPAVLREWKDGTLSTRTAAKELSVSRGTFLKWAKG